MLCFALPLTSASMAAPPLTEVKLQCNLEISTEFFYKKTADTIRETRRENASVSIQEFGKRLIIIVEGTEPLVSVATTDPRLPQLKKHLNLSTDLVWYLTNEINYGEGTEGTTDVKIDRNTGLLTFSQTKTSPGSISKISGSGNCSKVDTSKKKF